jgi:SAM-dependent methyltransferase
MIVTMRFSLKGSTPAEWLALRLGAVPVAAAEALGGMALSGMVIAAVRTGMTARLADGSWTAAELAADLELAPVPAQLLLEGLRSAGHVRAKAGRYTLSRSGRRWLAPRSALSVAAYVAGASDYWDWWAGLDAIAKGGPPVGHHDAPPDDPYWRRYVLGQLDLARLSATEVARKVALPRGARSVLDVGGGHGWYSAELCRRHPGLSATVLDLPGSAAIGREVIAAAGMAGQVRHANGDARTADLSVGHDGAGHDAVLCFNLVHHLQADDVAAFFARAHAALAPGGVLAVLDVFAGRGRRVPAHESLLALFTYLSSGARVHSEAELHAWLREAGFASRPRKVRVPRIPGQALYLATR